MPAAPSHLTMLRPPPALIPALLPRRWLVIAKQREQRELYKTLKARLREYVNVVSSCTEGGSAAGRAWPQDACGPCDPARVSEQARVTLDKLADGSGHGGLLQQLDEEVKLAVARMQAKALGKVGGTGGAGGGVQGSGAG